MACMPDVNPLSSAPGAAMIRSAWAGSTRPMVWALLAIAALYPVVIWAAAFPTPYIDILELKSWGIAFPLYTWKHPPLPAWVVGAAALLGPRDAWYFMALGQLLNLATLFYAGRIARDFIGREAVLPIVILVGGSVYLSASLPTIALNSDQLQAPLWSALVYYGMRAARDDGWLDWMLFAAALGLSFLADTAVTTSGSALVRPGGAGRCPGGGCCGRVYRYLRRAGRRAACRGRTDVEPVDVETRAVLRDGCAGLQEGLREGRRADGGHLVRVTQEAEGHA
jgi:hypothetical protein